METIIKILLLLSVSVLLTQSGDCRRCKVPLVGASQASLKRTSVRSLHQFEARLKASLKKKYGTFDARVRSEFTLSDEKNSAPPVTDMASTTNRQVQAVDESDRLKSDGRHLFVSTINGPGIKVFAADGAKAPLLGELRLDTPSKKAPLSGLYLRPKQKQLIALAGDGRLGGSQSDRSTQVFTIDAAAPATLSVSNQLTLDGQLISSRRIGSVLYLATRYSAAIAGLIKQPSSVADAAANRALIASTSLHDLLPSYQSNGTKQPLFAPEDCFFAGEPQANGQPHSFISLLAIDLDQTLLTPSGQCFIGDVETVYASAEAMYLATTQHQYTEADNHVIYAGSPTTEIHKFALQGAQTDYVGSASIEGHLGWQQGQKSFRMSEDDGLLRVLSYVGEQADSVDSPARLHVLQESVDRDSLEVVATLPNENRPAPLGKKGEQIYASRFMGKRGYLVTFKSTDPLYILDLSNPYDPYIVSALEVEGYSDYLHPVGENFLLGIGKHAIAQTPDEDTFGDISGAWYQGVKLSIIDISDPLMPRETQKIILGKRGTETAASTTHHALTTLLSGNQLRVNIPVSLYEEKLERRYGAAADHPADYSGWTRDALYRFTVGTESGEMAFLKPIVAPLHNVPQKATYYFAASTAWRYDRSAIVNGHSYYLKQDKIFVAAD